MNNNIKYRIKFTKTHKMVFIGHLDLLKFFQRAIKRSGIPIAYSQGFNPHQLITFAIPLSLGISSVGEYMDIQLTKEVSCNEIVNSLNAVMPAEGVEILSAKKLTEGEKTCAAAVEVGDYVVTIPESYSDLENAIEKILSLEEINVERTVKKKTKITNIRPFIFSLKGGGNTINATIATGSQSNLKIELLIEEILKLMGREYHPYKTDIKRLELYKREKGEVVPL